MSNYDQMLAFGQQLFLTWDQQAMIRRCGLRADADFLYLNFLGQPHRVNRKNARVENLSAGAPAGFHPSLCIYDLLCRSEPLPGLSGAWRGANALKHVAQSSPDPVSLHQAQAQFFQDHLPALQAALADIALAPFPQGDAACVFPVFDCMPAVFQFWEGDEEFPPSVRFLWDENALSYQRYETLYYVMHALFERLRLDIEKIEGKTSK